LLAKKFYTPLEYLKREEAAEFKSEYDQGVIIPMAGASFPHNRIATNVVVALQVALKRKPCQAFGSDLRVQVREKAFVYPDALVICGEPEFAKGRNDTITNPTVIVEVLSPSTRAYDRGRKFELYRTLPSLQAYVIVDSEQPYVDYFQKRPDGTWELTEHRQLSDKLKLSVLHVMIPLADIYDKAAWAKPSTKHKSKKNGG
jgi:Uma2 family endonuclease